MTVKIGNLPPRRLAVIPLAAGKCWLVLIRTSTRDFPRPQQASAHPAHTLPAKAVTPIQHGRWNSYGSLMQRVEPVRAVSCGGCTMPRPDSGQVQVGPALTAPTSSHFAEAESAPHHSRRCSIFWAGDRSTGPWMSGPSVRSNRASFGYHFSTSMMG